MAGECAVIIVAAGRGVRAGGGEPKQWREIAGRSIAARSVAAFRAVAGLGRIVLVVHPRDKARARADPELGDPILADGGDDRQASVLGGLEALAADPPERVLIHDVARPLVRPGVIARVRAALDTAPAAAPALPVTDALWTGEGGRVRGSHDRAGLWRAQTPQGFHFAPILAAHRAHPGGAPDDVAVARGAGLDTVIVEGDEDNIKITAPADFARAARLMEQNVDIRTGTGFDVHAFADGDRVTLCGVAVPHSHALTGHSDADVGMHALTDAIYGALAEGDIGRHFPPSDARWKGADSRIFLAHAAGRVRDRGFALSHADVTLICEAPKIGPHADAMRTALAAILGVEGGRVSVKATTTERLGFAGRGEGIAALATATLIAR